MKEQAATRAAELLPYYSPITFYFVLGMAIACFILFAYIAISDAVAKRREVSRTPRNLESMTQVGDLAEKFYKSGHGPSALACAVLFVLIGTGIALALDKLTILPGILAGGGAASAVHAMESRTQLPKP
ncbi:MAG: hypothetical protein ABL907_01870 [Hyphomicrobium sp.]